MNTTAVVPIRLYSDRAAKFAPRPAKVAGEPITAGASPNILEDYCANSSIHGFKYFVGSKRTKLEKIWWLAMCLLSIYGCARLIDTVYDKWRRSPVVVTFAEKPTSIRDIPFPAVTICPLTKVKSSELNFTAVYLRLLRNDTTHDISEEELDRFLAMNQVCEFSFNNYLLNQTYDDNIVSVLQEMAIPFSEMFLMCVWKNHYVNCSDLFHPVLTEQGICYSFNGLSANNLLRRDAFHDDFEYLGEQRSSENWTMEEGYKPNLGMHTYPRRTMSPGSRAGLVVLLKSELDDMDYLCENSFQGFYMQIHTPNQWPEISNQRINIPMNHALQVRIEPFQMTTSQNVRPYSPSKRLCYYTHERYLRFFKIYTKRNCELECLANFTLRLCDCVLFSMPRGPGVRMCGVQKLACCARAEAILQEQDLKHEPMEGRSRVPVPSRTCNCLPACSYLQYNAEISQSHFQWQRLTSAIGLFQDELENADLSTIRIYFREAHFIGIKRNQLFGVDDFIANCGGILGLFMGVSLLSIVEMLYYFTMKPLINRFFQRPRNERKVITLVEPVKRRATPRTDAISKFLREVA